jgi:enoyl-CoA hydratase
MTTGNDDKILKSCADGILELVLNRPDKLNALTTAMFATIRDAVDEMRQRDDLRVMLIRAKGEYFSAGADLAEGQKQEFDGSPSRARAWFRTDMGSGLQRLYEEMERVEKPIVVAHHARCVGGALELSLSADFRLAARSASYWFPEMQIGMLPLSNGVARLTRLCGGHWARWMVLANEEVSSAEALTMGLVHKVYDDETFDTEVAAFCRKLAGFPVEVLAAGKVAIEMIEDLPADQARQAERVMFSSLTFTPERAELARRVRERLTDPSRGRSPDR